MVEPKLQVHTHLVAVTSLCDGPQGHCNLPQSALPSRTGARASPIAIAIGACVHAGAGAGATVADT